MAVRTRFYLELGASLQNEAKGRRKDDEHDEYRRETRELAGTGFAHQEVDPFVKYYSARFFGYLQRNKRTRV
eukprot:9324161-Pyramimonas_sp.AAC.1